MRKIGAVLVACVATVAIAGCSSGPVIHATIGKGTKFCTDLAAFGTRAATLTDAASAPLATLQSEVPPVHDSLVALANEAPAADTVGGHSVKTDLNTEANVYGALVTALQQASASDPNAVANALKKVQDQFGGAATDATGRLDSYSNSVCGVGVTATTAPGSTTTAASGAGSSGASGATTTVLPVGPAPAAATTTVAP